MRRARIRCRRDMQEGDLDGRTCEVIRRLRQWLAHEDGTPAMLDPIEPYDIREVSAITHAHPVAEWSCVALCNILRTIRNVGTPAKGDLWHRCGHIASRPVGAVESNDYCEHTLEAALWCFLNTTSYADCVLTAVNLGYDTDTTAAVAGAIAGVYYGFGAIPPEWVGRLRGKAVID